MRTFLCLSIFLSLICIDVYAAPSNEQSLDSIVAVVNDALITQTELNNAMAAAKKQIAASNTPVPAETVLHKQVLQQLIDRKLQLQLAELGGIHIKDEELNNTLTRIAQANNMTLPQLYEQLPTQGLSVAEYRKQIQDEIMIQQVEQHEIGAKISITPQEISDFKRSKAWQASTNKEYHLEDILVAVPDTPTTQQVQDAKKHADDILAKIHHGTSFHSAAIAESSGEKALQGGDLGWRKLPEVPSVFAEEIMHMQANDVAGPIQAPNGYHILHLAGVRSADAQNTVSDKQIEQLIFQRKLEEALPSWLAKIRSQAFINTHPEA
jgi:peptidyl-prolyl cis-trans isomerase SurA